MSSNSVNQSDCSLPSEIWELIFSQLPLPDLLCQYACVCKNWASIINNPIFLSWKKIYFSLKLGRKTPFYTPVLGQERKNEEFLCKSIMNKIFDTYNLKDLQTFLANTISYMQKYHQLHGSLEFNLSLLKAHPLFDMALRFLQWVPEDVIAKPHGLWHYVSTIIIFSKDVWDVQNVLKLLLSPKLELSSVDVIEGFYCLATLFLEAATRINFPTRFHYNVYYTLYLYENKWGFVSNVSTPSENQVGQQAITNYMVYNKGRKLTYEQSKIVHYDIKKSDTLKIVAFAGTGKTTTLEMFCQNRPNMKFLMVVYNESVQEHCSSFFPKNTTVKTAHSLAYSKIGHSFSEINKLEMNLKPVEIVKILANRITCMDRFTRAGLVRDTLKKFVYSADDRLTLLHVPTEDSRGEEVEDYARRDVVFPDALDVWEEMRKCSSSQRISLFQDGMLKLWHLSKPKIEQYDVIMVNEAHDMNPAMLNVIQNQNCAKIVVGDPFQQIYAFTGATDALETIIPTQTFYLTQSFRFGPEIGFVGNSILTTLLNVCHKTLVGGNKKDSFTTDLSNKANMQQAILCRSNLTVYKVALNYCKNSANDHKLIGFVGGINKYGYEDVIDIYKLFKMEKGDGTPEEMQITSKLITKFDSVAKLRKYALSACDVDMDNKLRMFDYSSREGNVARDVQLLKERCSGDAKCADIVFSTIHKAKGLEWDWVILEDDLIINSARPRLEKIEYHLLYVAVTRAKVNLTLNTAALTAIIFSHENFEFVAMKSDNYRISKCVKCHGPCHNAANTSPVATKILNIPLANNTLHLEEGYLCELCMGDSIEKLPMCGGLRPRTCLNYKRIALYYMMTGKMLPASSCSWTNPWYLVDGNPNAMRLKILSVRDLLPR